MAAMTDERPQPRVSYCRSCGAEIWWGKTAKGKDCPYDVEDGVMVGRSHFESCPDASRWGNGR